MTNSSREQTGMDEKGRRNSAEIRTLMFLVEGQMVAEQVC